MKYYFDIEYKLREKLVQMVILYKIFYIEKLDKNERHKVYCQMYKPLKFYTFSHLKRRFYIRYYK